ncbi:MAG: SIS domain-containing protein [Oscillospiraceae bacterium]|nr:SIS domain-containing protein [Oscillospiraceae bacterium]
MINFSERYYHCLTRTLEKIRQTQTEKIREAAVQMAGTIERGGLIHVFGCGHSHMLAEELFYRAGGIVDIDPIFDSSVMLHEGAVKSSQMERMSGIARHLLARYEVGEKDTLLIASTSGINPYPIEMALGAKARGCRVVAITSQDYADVPSRHVSGKHLFDLCDICVDNCVKKGDACVCVLPQDGVYAGPLSSLSAFFIANTIMLETSQVLLQKGEKPKIFVSGNISGADEKNSRYVQEYQSRIKHL